MFEKLLQSSPANRVFAFVPPTLLGAFGYYAFKDLTIEAFPEPRATRGGRPVAVVVAGGALSAALRRLVVLPVTFFHSANRIRDAHGPASRVSGNGRGLIPRQR